jgi:hypothetical protein
MNDRFEPTGNSTVIDHETGLEWQASTSGPMTWQEAMDYASSLGDGWRLPTIEELITLIDYSQVDPATNFPNHLATGFWSSSVHAYYTGYAWSVYFSSGYVYGNGKYNGIRVRCVRSGLQDGGA